MQHFALLIGYGAGAINPYLAFETLVDMIQQRRAEGRRRRTRRSSTTSRRSTRACSRSMSKMGISTVQSYRGAQIFEASASTASSIDRYFTWTPSRIEGVGLDVIAEECAARHHHAFEVSPSLDGDLDVGGQYQWRRRGEYHMYNPETIAKLQHAVRKGSYALFKEYTRAGRRRQPRARARCAACCSFKPAQAGADRGGRAGERDRQALQDRRDVARLDQPRGAREPRDRHEPHRRQVEHRRGRRGSGALHARRRTATCAAARSSRWPRAASA